MSYNQTGPHRYDSGVYFDTAPEDVVSCCNKRRDDPIHDVPCPRCGTAHGVTYECGGKS
jgi:hypothetical protein